MRAEIEIDSESPDKIEKILSPSLESRGKVELSTSADKDSVDVEIETDGLGPLRGTTDNVFRLGGLAKKIYEER